MYDSITDLPLSNSFAGLSEDFFSRVQPTPFQAHSTLVHFNNDAAALLDLNSEAQFDPRFISVLSGSEPLPGADPLAMLYCGHQFGQLVHQLGDGRAIMLAETTNADGEKWEIQLKGSGKTPYSRGGDGRAVLRSTIREYLCSEAIHGLGIPTTRALCLTSTDDEVYREQIETGAVLTRLAPSHVRFGSFEVFFYRDQHDQIRTLADYVITHHYPELLSTENPYQALLDKVINRTAKLIAQWQAVGFCHGVMNTDNMSILGLTIDYGPFGFLEAYDPGFICNHSDHQGRYAYDQQPQIGLFNCSCLAQALLPLLDVEQAKTSLQTYQELYTSYADKLMVEKMGFEETNETNLGFVDDLLKLMQQSRADFTRVFRELGNVDSNSSEPHTTLRDMFTDRESFDHWLNDYRAQLRLTNNDDDSRRQTMMACNPKYILRNYLAQVAIEKAEKEKDYSEIEKLMIVLSNPFDEHEAYEDFAKAPPDWADNLSVSCSS